MKTMLIILGYLKWHYSKAISSLCQILKNFLVFIFNYFSIRLLFVNFFDPWKRMSDQYPKVFNFQEYFNTFLANSIMRVVGIIMRFALLIIGLSCCTLFVLICPILIVLWICLPFAVIFLIGDGLYLIIQ